MKVCTKCGTEKPLTEFYRQGHRLRTDCKACVIARSDAWRRIHPERKRAISIKWYRAHKDTENAKQRARRKANPNRAGEAMRMRAWRKANPEKAKAECARWAKANPAWCAAKRMRRHAAKLRAVPKWVNNFFVEEIYDLAARRTKVMGFKWQVDHIVPLQSPLVCGLHVEHNLQVIPAIENLKKHNRIWPDMP